MAERETATCIECVTCGTRCRNQVTHNADTQNGQRQQEAPRAAMAMKTRFPTRTFGLKNHPAQTEDAAAEISIFQSEKPNA